MKLPQEVEPSVREERKAVTVFIDFYLVKYKSSTPSGEQNFRL